MGDQTLLTKPWGGTEAVSAVGFAAGDGVSAGVEVASGVGAAAGVSIGVGVGFVIVTDRLKFIVI